MAKIKQEEFEVIFSNTNDVPNEEFKNKLKYGETYTVIWIGLHKSIPTTGSVYSFGIVLKEFPPHGKFTGIWDIQNFTIKNEKECPLEIYDMIRRKII